MKYCSQCGSGMQDGDKFCMKCGNEYAKNGGAKSTVPTDPADQQQPSGQNNADTSQLVVDSQIAPQTTPPARSRRGSGPKTKLIIGAVLAILLVFGGVWGWNTYGTEARVEKKLDLAVKYISDNNYEQAILAFNDAIKIDPKDVKGYQGLAKAYTLQGNYDEARNTYEKGIAAVNRQNKQILQLGLAGMYIDQNKLTDAEQAYSDIINTSPDCLEACWGLAMVYQQQGDSSKAEAILRQAVANNPDEYRGYNTLALFLSQNNKKDDALNNIVQSLTLEMNQQEAYLVLDSMYQNNWAELRNKTTSLSNQNVAAMIEFYSYYAADDYPNAINTYQNKLSTQTTNQKAKILAAIAMLKNGDKTSAEDLIKQLNVSKLNGWLLSDLGRYYLAAGDQAKAKEYAIKSLQADPTNLDAIALLQAINANDPDAKIYTAKALLYNWKPAVIIAAEMQKHNLSIGIIEKDIREGEGFKEKGSAVNQFNNEPTFTVTFSTRNTSQTYINKAGVPIDVTLSIPQLRGSYAAIPAINRYYEEVQKKIADPKALVADENSGPPGSRFCINAEFKLAAVLGNIISIKGQDDYSWGGTGLTKFYGDTFNLENGKKLSLDDIFRIESDEYLSLIYDRVSKKINEEISRKDSDKFKYFFDNVYSAQGVKAIHDYNINNWYLTDQSLVVVYEQGTLGPNASGIFSYEIPLDSIKDKLKISY